MRKYKYLIFTLIGLNLAAAGSIFAAPQFNVQRSIIPEANDQYFVGSTSPATRYSGIYIGTASSTFLGNVGIGTTTAGTRLSIQGVGNFEDGTSTVISGLVVPSLTATSGIAITGGCFKLPTGNCLSAGASVAGSDTQVQFNDSGAFGADAQLTYNKTTDLLTLLYASSSSIDITNLLTVGGTGTSTFAGHVKISGNLEVSGLSILSVVTSGNFDVKGLLTSQNATTTGSASVGNLININGTGTSTFAGGISISTIGGLSTISGITITGGQLLATNIKAIFGSTTAVSPSFTNGIVATGDLLLTNGKIVASGTGTSTFSGGSFAGLSSSAGLNITGGILNASNLTGMFAQVGSATSSLLIATSTNSLNGSVQVKGDIFLKGQAKSEWIPMPTSVYAPVFDCREGNRFTLTVNKSPTIITPKNCQSGDSVLLRVAEDSTGGRIILFATSSTVNGQYASTTGLAVNWFGLVFQGNFGYVLMATATNPTN